MNKLLILGAGGYAQTIADMARQSGEYDRIGFLDDSSHGAYILGSCGEFQMFTGENVDMYPAFGNNETRMYWMDQLEQAGIHIPSLVHHSAYVSPTVRLKPGTMVLPKAVINTGCQIGRGCILNCGSIVDHGCILEEGVHVCLGAIVKAENHIPSKMKVEAGQVIQNGQFPI